MKYLHIIYACACFILGTIPTIHIGAAGQNQTNNTTVYSCNCTNCVCNFYINAVGDLRDIKLPTDPSFKPNQLGSITQPKSTTLKIPDINSMVVYVFTTTMPYSPTPLDTHVVGKQMSLLFISEKADTELLKQQPSAKTMTKVYRRISPEKLWTEVATLAHEVTIKDLPQLSVTIESNGNASWMEGNAKKTIPLGKAIM